MLLTSRPSVPDSYEESGNEETFEVFFSSVCVSWPAKALKQFSSELTWPHSRDEAADSNKDIPQGVFCRGDEQTLQQTYFRGSASCVQSFDDSLDFAIRMTYRISLRSSSLWEPRHPLLKVLISLLFFFGLRITVLLLNRSLIRMFVFFYKIRKTEFKRFWLLKWSKGFLTPRR